MKKRQVTTITPNPAIDKTYWLEGLQPGRQNRVSRVRVDPGGKGLNIARLLKGYDLEVAAIGFFGGIIGRELIHMLRTEGVEITPVFVDGNTRTNTKIMDPTSGEETEINEPGPYVGAGEQKQLLQLLSDYAVQSGYTVFSGSLPQGCPADYYRDLIATAQTFGCKTLLDTSGAALREGIKAAPDLIKPNQQELSELLGREITTPAMAAEAAMELRRAYGIAVVVVSLGALGAVMASEEGTYHAIPPKVKPENTIGAGDSLMAGFIYGMVSDRPLAECLRLGVASGTLAVTDQATSVAKPQFEAVLAMEKRVELKRLD
ncbi:1-phosphofructokinase [Capillibacterium thermochitinicola]|uniref:Tagatose-6-phosphate kinase n=1 Tax=Capillibacterium thermochitinicola TaxID=2699427 RepID=A0A8J6I269_9FIRM|nr:1-phosphofructokinase [Capillibacterium thermochitinicola]MBA2133888.1 1-phosphofructokinase [Capillibacterium thermochitinicola]